MTEQTNAELAAAAKGWTPEEVRQKPVGASRLLKAMAVALEAADQRAAEYAAVVEKVREICVEASGAEERNVATSRALGYASLSMREHVPSLVEVREALATAPADALREHDAALIEGLADEFAARLPDGTGNGRAYNSHTVAQMLREKARQRREK